LHNGVAGILQNVIDQSVFATTTTTTEAPDIPELPPRRPLPPYHLYNTYPRPRPDGTVSVNLEGVQNVAANPSPEHQGIGPRPRPGLIREPPLFINRRPFEEPPKSVEEDVTTAQPSTEDEDLTDEEDGDNDNAL